MDLRLFLLTLVTTLISTPLWALKFDPVDAEKLKHVTGLKSALWIRDCGSQGFKETCAEGEDQFSAGDEVKLRAQLRSGRYEEIWFASGGGNLNTGIAIGQVLRQSQATVRVPAGYHCVSACTVAFLGGLFRFVDEGATYEVHSASRFLHGFDCERCYAKKLLADLNADPESQLRNFASEETEIARDLAAQLFSHCQRALLPLGKLPQEAAVSGVLAQWLRYEPPIPYQRSAQLESDADRLRREGAPAAQEILMRIEQDTMHQAIAELRAIIPKLGARASGALDMLDAMYSSRILSTYTMSQQTMVQMGYVTKIFDMGSTNK